MMCQAKINIIKCTDSQQFTFSTTVTDLSLLPELVFKFNLSILFCRCGKEDNLSIQFLSDLRNRQCKCSPEHACHLCMMSTAMCRIGLRICKGMLRDTECIQFSQQCKTCISFFILIQIRLYSCDRKSLFSPQSQLFHFFHKLPGSLKFFISKLCMGINIPCKFKDFFSVPVDRFYNKCFCLIHCMPLLSVLCLLRFPYGNSFTY